MDFFIDAEFIEGEREIDLVSLAVVSAGGREFYAVSNEFDASAANDFVVGHVLPQLEAPGDPVWMSRQAIKRGLLDLVGDETPRFWSWGGAPYDWMVMAQLFDLAERVPGGWAYTAHDITLLAQCHGFVTNPVDARLPQPPANVHHALADARWARDVFNFMGGSPAVAAC